MSLEERKRLQQEAIDNDDGAWEKELKAKNKAKSGFFENNDLTNENKGGIMSVGGEKMNAGGIFGALDPNSAEADKHATRYYEFVRSTNSDVDSIASNTGIESETIQNIKNYLFVDEHNLGGVLQRFDPNYDISQSWQRLWQGDNIQTHDMTLLRHEIYERELVKQGNSQNKAHVIASEKYNYTKEVYDYHAKTD